MTSNEKLEEYPFKTIWTVYLLWYKDTKGIFGCRVNKLRPDHINIDTSFDDEILKKQQPAPIFMEEIKIKGKTFFSFKKDFIQKINS